MTYKKLLNAKTILGAGILAATFGISPAFAISSPNQLKVDAGPLGMLDVSGGFDAYMYAMSGANANTLLGTNKDTGAEARVLDLSISKSTGLVQFTLEVKPDDSLYFGVAPSSMTAKTFTLGPVYAAYVTLAPSPEFNISVGQVYSVEGYESSTDWHNPNIIDSPLYYVENSSSRGVSATFTKGPISATVVYGDGFDSGVFNVVQGLVTYNFNSDNNLNIYGETNLGTTGPNTFAYGGGKTGYGYAAYNPAYVNSTMIGGYYSYTNGNLTLVPEVQYVYAKVNHKIGIDKFTSNFGAQLIGNYQFGKSPWSVGWQIMYYSNNGPEAWYLNANSAGVMAGITPTWQKGHLFVRGEVGMMHLTQIGNNWDTTPSGSTIITGHAAGFGSSGTDRNQVLAALEAGLVF